jgi:hypothetical protein
VSSLDGIQARNSAQIPAGRKVTLTRGNFELREKRRKRQPKKVGERKHECPAHRESHVTGGAHQRRLQRVSTRNQGLSSRCEYTLCCSPMLDSNPREFKSRGHEGDRFLANKELAHRGPDRQLSRARTFELTKSGTL